MPFPAELPTLTRDSGRPTTERNVEYLVGQSISTNSQCFQIATPTSPISRVTSGVGSSACIPLVTSHHIHPSSSATTNNIGTQNNSRPISCRSPSFHEFHPSSIQQRSYYPTTQPATATQPLTSTVTGHNQATTSRIATTTPQTHDKLPSWQTTPRPPPACTS